MCARVLAQRLPVRASELAHMRGRVSGYVGAYAGRGCVHACIRHKPLCVSSSQAVGGRCDFKDVT